MKSRRTRRQRIREKRDKLRKKPFELVDQDGKRVARRPDGTRIYRLPGDE